MGECLRSATEMSLVSGVSARHLEKILNKEATAGEHHKRWIKKRLKEDEVRALTHKLSKKDVIVRALSKNSLKNTDVSAKDYGFIPNCPPEQVKVGDLLALETHDGLHWIHVDEVSRDESRQRISVVCSGLEFYLYPNDYMRVLRSLGEETHG